MKSTLATSRQKPENVTVEQKVAFLSRPEAYARSLRAVEVKETHMSWVFLAGERVYKLKKPVRFPFLDFSTLAAREADCRAELRLNRRLAPDVYLAVVPLTCSSDGALALNGAGSPVDWLVVMRRLPAESMLDHAVADAAVHPRHIEEVGQVLAQFYRRAERPGMAPEDYVTHFVREQESNRSVLADERFELPRDLRYAALDAIDETLAGDPDLLQDRARQGRIVDGHGDLRPEHVCLLSPPRIIDCLEFNRRYRLIDPFDELSFLGMECRQLGAPWIGSMLVARCGDLLDDRPPRRLLAFYIAYRACLRARLALAHLLDPEPSKPDKWLPLAACYLSIAQHAAVRLRLPQARSGSRPHDSAG